MAEERREGEQVGGGAAASGPAGRGGLVEQLIAVVAGLVGGILGGLRGDRAAGASNEATGAAAGLSSAVAGLVGEARQAVAGGWQDLTRGTGPAPEGAAPADAPAVESPPSLPIPDPVGGVLGHAPLSAMPTAAPEPPPLVPLAGATADDFAAAPGLDPAPDARGLGRHGPDEDNLATMRRH